MTKSWQLSGTDSSDIYVFDISFNIFFQTQACGVLHVEFTSGQALEVPGIVLTLVGLLFLVLPSSSNLEGIYSF